MSLKYLSHYTITLQQQVQQLIDSGQLNHYIKQKYPELSTIQTDKALYHYVSTIKKQFLKNIPPVDKVLFDSKLDVTHHALGLNKAISRIQGAKLNAKTEIRIASIFKTAPIAFLNMVVVHELAHLKIRSHDKSFYQLCVHMLPNYHQLEFDLRVYLTGLYLESESRQ